MKKLALILTIGMAGIHNIMAQESDSASVRNYYNKPKSDNSWQKIRQKISVGGYGGATFGTITNINLSPTVGYKITDRNVLGVGINYFYYADKRYVPTYVANVYGGNIFDRQYISNQLFLQAEYQTLNYDSGTGYRTWNDYIMAGGGYMPQKGFYIMALYILQGPVNSIYGQTPLVIRAGVMF